MVRNEYVANMYKSGAVFRILNKVYIFTDNLYCMVFSVNQHLLGRSNFNIKARYIKKLNIWVTCCRVWSKIQFYGLELAILWQCFGLCHDFFFEKPMSRVLVFIQKMLINHFPVDTLLTDTTLYGRGGRGSTRLYKAALQRAGFFVPFWSVNGCKFPQLWSETENG